MSDKNHTRLTKPVIYHHSSRWFIDWFSRRFWHLVLFNLLMLIVATQQKKHIYLAGPFF